MSKKVTNVILGGTLGLCLALTAVSGVAIAGEAFTVRQVPFVVTTGTPLSCAEDSLSIEPVGTRVVRSVLNMSHPPGRFGDDTFPDPTIMDDFVVEARTEIVVKGKQLVWTFGVGSDDGFLLEIEGGAFVDWDETFNAFFGPGDSETTVTENTLSYDGFRAYAESYGVFQFDHPGVHSIRIVYFDGIGDAALEFFAARGNQLGKYDPAPYELVESGQRFSEDDEDDDDEDDEKHPRALSPRHQPELFGAR